MKSCNLRFPIPSPFGIRGSCSRGSYRITSTRNLHFQIFHSTENPDRRCDVAFPVVVYVASVTYFIYLFVKMSKRESSREDLPTQRVLRQRELIETLRHNNEILKLDLTKESRENKRTSSTGAIKDITRSSDPLLSALIFPSLPSLPFPSDYKSSPVHTCVVSKKKEDMWKS